MQSLSQINKTIEINGSFNIHMPCNTVMIGSGNCLSVKGHIVVSKSDGNYIVNIYNVNEWNRFYAPHGEYVYYVNGNEITYKAHLVFYENDNYSYDWNNEEPLYEYKENDILSTPFGWTDEMIKVSKSLLKTLKGE